MPVVVWSVSALCRARQELFALGQKALWRQCRFQTENVRLLQAAICSLHTIQTLHERLLISFCPQLLSSCAGRSSSQAELGLGRYPAALSVASRARYSRSNRAHTDWPYQTRPTS